MSDGKEKMFDKEKMKMVEETADELGLDETSKAAAQIVTALGGNPVKLMIAASNTKETKKAEDESPEWKYPDDWDDLHKALVEMATENTGVHMLDSGGSMGRGWQQMRGMLSGGYNPFEQDLVVEVDADRAVNATINVMSFLYHQLNITGDSKDLQEIFDKIANENTREAWHEIKRLFFSHLFNKSDDRPSYGYEKLYSENTYNRDCILSKTLQYVMFKWEDDIFILLEMHNGADVRGGYSAPAVFAVTDEDNWHSAESNLGASCDCLQMYSDQYGYHWHTDGSKYGDQVFTWDNETDFPDQWIPKPVDPDKTDRWDDHHLHCTGCQTKVEFQAYVEW